MIRDGWPAPAAPVDDEELQHLAALWSAIGEYVHRSERCARRNGLTPQRHRLLLMVAARDGATIAELADRLRLTHATTADLVLRSERAGLVERDVTEDEARVRPTAEGTRRLAAVVADMGGEHHRLELRIRSREP